VLRAGGIVGVLLLALAMVVVLTPGTRAVVVGLVVGPTPMATVPLADGNDHFAVENQLPWGTLQIDGQPGPALVPAPSSVPNPTSVPQLITFALARGRHHLEYQADPFPPLRCTLSVPAAPSDTCPIDPQPIDYLVPTGRLTRLLDLLGTPDRLSPSEQALLADATQVALARTAAGAAGTVAPGDHYLGADAQVMTAGQTLNAATTYRFEPPATPISVEHCAMLCVSLVPWAAPSATEWLLTALVDLSWSYRDASGHMLLADGLPGPPSARQAVGVSVGVRRVAGGWQVHLIPPTPSGTVVPDPLLCPIGAHYLDVLRATPGQATIDLNDLSYQWPVSAFTPQLGCVFGGSRYLDSQGTPTGSVALVLYRFGALLAVNDEAHNDFPKIPRATGHERTLALGAWPPTPKTAGPGG
jgi:hypothetical protein